MPNPNKHHDPGSPARPATPEETRTALIDRSGRSFVPVPKVFVQNPDPMATPDRSAPLADFVRRGDKRGLIAFLLLHTIISSGEPDGWSSTLHLPVWARALNTVTTASGSSATSAATKILTRLVERKLIERERTGRERKVKITLLRADGSGDPYSRPTGAGARDRFIRLNHTFWTDGWDEKLSLPGVAMLLVSLHEKPGFTLATEHMSEWYGWSADTAERGFSELGNQGLVDISQRTNTEPLSPTGLVTRNVYTILPPFDHESVDRSIKANQKGRR